MSPFGWTLDEVGNCSVGCRSPGPPQGVGHKEYILILNLKNTPPAKYGIWGKNSTVAQIVQSLSGVAAAAAGPCDISLRLGNWALL